MIYNISQYKSDCVGWISWISNTKPGCVGFFAKNFVSKLSGALVELRRFEVIQLFVLFMMFT